MAPEPQAVTLDLFREEEEAGVPVAEEAVRLDGAFLEEVLDLVARWPQLEEMRRAGGHRGKWEQALSLVVWQRYGGLGPTRQAAEEE